MLTQNQAISKNNLNLVTAPQPNSKLITEDNLERWLEDLTQYERTLEDMAKASLQPSFKEELGAVEGWFSELNEAERTATLYSLLHQTTYVQIRFFITILQKMNSDPIHGVINTTPKQGLQTLSDLPNSTRLKVINQNYNEPTSSASADSSPNTPVHPLSLKSQSYNRDDANCNSIKKEYKPVSSGSGRKHSRSLSYNGRQVDLAPVSTWPKAIAEDSSHPHPSKDYNSYRPKTATFNTNSDRRNLKNLNIKVDQIELVANDKNGYRPKTAHVLSVTCNGNNTGFSQNKLSPICWAATPSEPIHPKLNSPPYPSSSNSHHHLKDINSGIEKELVKVLEPIDFAILENVPQWMRSLRLHKYTSLFEKLDWKQIIHFDDSQLESLGVAALGARRKFLKVFEQILKEAKEQGIDCGAGSSGNRSTKKEQQQQHPIQSSSSDCSSSSEV